MKSNGSQKQKIRLVWICSLIPPPKLWLVDCDVEVWKLDITSERQMKETLNEKQSYSSPACLPVPSHRNERFQALLLFHMCAEVIIYSLQPVFQMCSMNMFTFSALGLHITNCWLGTCLHIQPPASSGLSVSSLLQKPGMDLADTYITFVRQNQDILRDRINDELYIEKVFDVSAHCCFKRIFELGAIL